MKAASFNVPTREVRLDLSGMYPRQDGDFLTLDMPSIPLAGPPLTADTFEILRSAGLDDEEVEREVETMMMRLETHILAKLLMERRR